MHIFEYFVSSWQNCLERIRCGSLVGGGVSLEVSFQVSKVTTFPVSSLCLFLVDQEVSSQLLPQDHVCLPTDMLHDGQGLTL